MGLAARADRHYLLAWRKQFLVCDRYFIEALGLDPDDADWAVGAAAAGTR